MDQKPDGGGTPWGAGSAVSAAGGPGITTVHQPWVSPGPGGVLLGCVSSSLPSAGGTIATGPRAMVANPVRGPEVPVPREVPT